MRIPANFDRNDLKRSFRVNVLDLYKRSCEEVGAVERRKAHMSTLDSLQNNPKLNSDALHARGAQQFDVYTEVQYNIFFSNELKCPRLLNLRALDIPVFLRIVLNTPI